MDSDNKDGTVTVESKGYELREQKFGYTRTIFPFPDEHPDVSVTLKKIPQSRLLRIYDMNGVRSDGKSPWVIWDKANRQIVLEEVVSWTGFTENAVPLDCTDKTKPRLLDNMVRGIGLDGGDIPLWKHILNLFDEQEREDEKN